MTAASVPTAWAAEVAPAKPSHTQRVLAWVTLVSLFAGGLKITVGIDLRLSYLFVAIATGMLLFMLGRPRILLWPILVLYAYLALSMLWVLWHEPSIFLGHTVPQIVGVGFFATFFFCMLPSVNLAPRQLFERYVDLACIVTLIGYPVLAYTTIAHGAFRFQGTLAEPQHYATVVMPALAFCLATFRERPGRALLLLSGVLLSFSLTGYVGLFVILVLAVGRRWWTRFALAIAGAAFAFTAYTTSSEIRSRINDTVNVAGNGDFAGANLSTYALLSNIFVAGHVVSDSPILGGGVGSHPLNHHRFVGNLVGIKEFEELLDQNSQDASSLLTRIVSEQGVLGVVLTMLFITTHLKSRNIADQAISNGILIYFVTKLIRDGHYFTPEFYFMVGIYYLLSVGNVIRLDVLRPLAS